VTKKRQNSYSPRGLDSPVNELSSRKLPQTGLDLVHNFRNENMLDAAEFFKPYTSYQIVNPDGMNRDDLQKIIIPSKVLNSMFNSVVTNSGEYAYPGEAKLIEVEPSNIYRIQNFIFKEHLDGMGDDINERYEGPTLIVDPKDKEMAIYMPPIVERHNDKQVLIDGLHRFYKAYTQNKNIKVVEIKAIVELPADMVGLVKTLKETDVLDKYIRTGEYDDLGRPKYDNLKPEHFRMYNLSGFGKFDKTKPKIKGMK